MSAQQEVQRLLDDILQEHGILGAALISRDGLTITAVGRPEMQRETFSAMAATLLGAAEIALTEFGAGKTDCVTATTGRARMILIGASRDMLLVAMADRETPADALVKRMEEAARAIAAAVGG